MPDSKYDVIVIGAGIAGLNAAKSAIQAGLATANIENMMFGGLVTNINELDPAPPGVSRSGTELAATLMTEITDLGAAYLSETVTALARNGDFITVTTDAAEHTARALVIASGAKLKRLGVPGEAEFAGRGVSQCADCDGPMYKDEEVVVVGGGDSALQEALVMANFGKRVHLVHRGDRFRAQQHLIDEVARRANISARWNTVVVEVAGTKMVNKVRVRNVADGATTDISCSGVFAYVGLEPNCEFVPAEIKRDANGFVLTDASMQTAMKSIYAAGAVCAGHGGLLTDAISEAHTAMRGIRSQLGK